MAEETQTAASPGPQEALPPQDWSTQDSERALAHLERLQDRIDHLRSAIPDLVRPLSTGRAKADVLNEVRRVALSKAEELRRFQEAWKAEGTQKVLERARESERLDGDLGRSGEVARWGWVEKVEGTEGKDGAV